MQINKILIVLVSINLFFLVGCAHKKTRVFGDNMPTMMEIHTEKFGDSQDKKFVRPDRSVDNADASVQSDFEWLPNPTLHLYVFKHLTEDGLPVPGYTTFFKMYRQDVIAEPGEEGGWE